MEKRGKIISNPPKCFECNGVGHYTSSCLTKIALIFREDLNGWIEKEEDENGECVEGEENGEDDEHVDLNPLESDDNVLSIQKDPKNFLANFWPNSDELPVDLRRQSERGRKKNFPNLLHRSFAYFFGHTLDQKVGGYSEVHIIDIYLLDKLHNRYPYYQQDHNKLLNSQLLITTVTHRTRRTKWGSHHPKKIGWGIATRLGASFLQPVENDAEANESYNTSNDEEEGAGAQNTVWIDAFQMGCGLHLSNPGYSINARDAVDGTGRVQLSICERVGTSKGINRSPKSNASLIVRKIHA
ncbi:hypothetical protein M9H77_18870 [Catharanthus roseus]|uniref:Uncharacterized protein n=1 Tax=Catharanthus roseus TaxID=4058 RepID=A0ACC0B8M3_CATRO|nr:hypothetical protein M9H77_18870 [Catharanthus roseus]